MPDSIISEADVSVAGSTASRRTFKARFLEMLGRDEPPELVAASFALGVAVSFTPLFGLHWVIALLLAVVLKLNKVDVILGTLVVNPLTFGPVAALALPVGRVILRAQREASSYLPWREVATRSFWHQAGPKMRVIGLHLAVGMFVLAILSGSLTYVLLVHIIRHHRARLATERARGASVDDTAPPSPS
jgi:uncharacterized protein (DUF2062 family)